MGTETEIIWLQEPITLDDIKGAATLFRDPNPVHRSTAAARLQFGDQEATGPVAPGALVMGLVGGMLTARYGEGTVAHEISKVKLSRCFCAGDRLGLEIEETYDKPKVGQRFVHLNVTIYRRRHDQTVPVCRKEPVYVEIISPIPA